MSRVLAVGQYDTDGKYQPYAKSLECVRFGNTLRDPDTGMVHAIQDQYGDWVDPLLMQLGRKSVVEVQDADAA